jgi:uncharacterized membrane protein
MTAASRRGTRSLESSIARLLTIGTYASIALVAVGAVLMLAGGVSPLDPAPGFDPSRIGSDLAALRPAGFLWLGILGLIATPAARVTAALAGYARTGERAMVVVSILILAVIAIGVATGGAAS